MYVLPSERRGSLPDRLCLGTQLYRQPERLHRQGQVRGRSVVAVEANRVEDQENIEQRLLYHQWYKATDLWC